MSRRKAEAERTREAILDAAEIQFLAQGVSRTTLAHIAAAAGGFVCRSMKLLMRQRAV